MQHRQTDPIRSDDSPSVISSVIILWSSVNYRIKAQKYLSSPLNVKAETKRNEKKRNETKKIVLYLIPIKQKDEYTCCSVKKGN